MTAALPIPQFKAGVGWTKVKQPTSKSDFAQPGFFSWGRFALHHTASPNSRLRSPAPPPILPPDLYAIQDFDPRRDALAFAHAGH